MDIVCYGCMVRGSLEHFLFVPDSHVHVLGHLGNLGSHHWNANVAVTVHEKLVVGWVYMDKTDTWDVLNSLKPLHALYPCQTLEPMYGWHLRKTMDILGNSLKVHILKMVLESLNHPIVTI